MKLVPISDMEGNDLGWVASSVVVRVYPGSGQRRIEFVDTNGVRQEAVRPHAFPDEWFMARLGLRDGPA